MLGKLRIRQKIGLLLAIPLLAVALVNSAIAIERVDEARAYAATVETALAARDVGGLIQTLQQERLLVMGGLAFGAGFLLSALLPATKVEAQASRKAVDLAKEHGEPVAERAREAGQEMAENLKSQTGEAMGELKETAQESVGKVKDETQQATETVREDTRQA